MADKPIALGPNPLAGPQPGVGPTPVGSTSPPSNYLQAQHRMYGIGGLISASVPYISANRPGNLLVCVVRAAGATRAEVTLSDSAGNIWKEAVRGDGIGDTTRNYIFYALNAVGGANTVTAVASSPALSNICIIEYHNGDQFNGPDIAVSVLLPTATTNVTCGNLQPGYTNEIWVECLTSSGNGNTTTGVGWNYVDTASRPDPLSPNTVVGNVNRWVVQDRLTTTIRPYNTEFNALNATTGRLLLAGFRTTSSQPDNLGASLGQGPGRFGNPKFAFPSVNSTPPPSPPVVLPQVLGGAKVITNFGPLTAGPDPMRTFPLTQGSLESQGRASGTAVVTAVAAGQLSGTVAVSGTSVVTTVATGSLGGARAASGVAVITTYATGDLTATSIIPPLGSGFSGGGGGSVKRHGKKHVPREHPKLITLIEKVSVPQEGRGALREALLATADTLDLIPVAATTKGSTVIEGLPAQYKMYEQSKEDIEARQRKLRQDAELMLLLMI